MPTPGQLAYEAYARITTGYPPDRVRPRWEDLPKLLQEGWEEAARVLRAPEGQVPGSTE